MCTDDAQREQVLLNEVEQRWRVGGLVDRRFGENDPSMSLEERMLARFTRERQRASRASAFNLEHDDALTHYGQRMDDVEDIVLPVEDDEGGCSLACEDALSHPTRSTRS